jgi:hypothetical protein
MSEGKAVGLIVLGSVGMLFGIVLLLWCLRAEELSNAKKDKGSTPVSRMDSHGKIVGNTETGS